MQKIPTLYSNYNQLILDINIYGNIVSIPQVDLEERKRLLFEEFKKQRPLPSMEDERYKLSNLISSDYKVTYDKELELQENEMLLSLEADNKREKQPVIEEEKLPDVIHNLFRYENNVTDADREAILQKYDLMTGQEFDLTDYESRVFNSVQQEDNVMTDEEIAELGTNTDDENRKEFKIELEDEGISVDIPNDEEEIDEEYEEEEIEEEYEEEEDDSDYEEEEIEDDDSDYEEEEEYEEEEIEEEIEEEYEEDDSDIEENEPETTSSEPEIPQPPPIQSTLPTETPQPIIETEEYDEEEYEDEEEVEEEEEWEDEEEIEEDDYEEEDYDDEEEEYEEEVEEDYEEEEDEEYEEEEDDEEEEYTPPPKKQSPPPQPQTVVQPQSTPPPQPQIQQSDTTSFIDSVFDSESDDDIEFITEDVKPKVVETPKVQVQPVQEQTQSNNNVEEEPKDLKQFLRKHPRCDYSFALQYFSEKEIKQAIKTGKIIKRGNTLRI